MWSLWSTVKWSEVKCSSSPLSSLPLRLSLEQERTRTVHSSAARPESHHRRRRASSDSHASQTSAFLLLGEHRTRAQCLRTPARISRRRRAPVALRLSASCGGGTRCPGCIFSGDCEVKKGEAQRAGTMWRAATSLGGSTGGTQRQ